MPRPISDRPFFRDARPTPGTPEARSLVSGSFLFAKTQTSKIPLKSADPAQMADDEGGRPSCMPAASRLRASAAQRSRREGHHSPALWPLGQFARKIFPVSSESHITHLEHAGRDLAYVVESVGRDRAVPVDNLWKSCGLQTACRRRRAPSVAISFQMRSSDLACHRPPPQLTPMQPQGAPTSGRGAPFLLAAANKSRTQHSRIPQFRIS